MGAGVGVGTRSEQTRMGPMGVANRWRLGALAHHLSLHHHLFLHLLFLSHPYSFSHSCGVACDRG